MINKNNIKLIIKRLYIIFVHRNKYLYDENHLNSMSFLHLLLMNIFFPGRLIERIKYKRLNLFFKNNKVNLNNQKDQDIFNKALNNLQHNGVAIIDQYFSEDKLVLLENHYKNYFDIRNLTSSNLTSWNSDRLPLSPILVELWTDELLLKIIDAYIGRRPIIRNYAGLQYVNPQFANSQMVEDEAYADEWHVDHSTLILCAVYLTDIYYDGSYMQVISGSHKKFNSSFSYLPNGYVDNTKNKIIHCYGKRGTVQIHCGNAFHRFRPANKKFRAWIKFEYSSGNNLLFNVEHSAKTLTDDYKLDNLTAEQREMFKGIYPLSPNKGFVLKGDYIRENKFKGV